jgi:hypothetical protein
MHVLLSSGQIWAARICTPRSATRVPFLTPFIVLPLTKGGGSRIERAGFNSLDQGAQFYRQDWIPDPLCLSTFNKGGGGGSGMGDFVWVPLSSPHNCLHLSSSTIYLPLHISPPLSAILAHLILISTSCLPTPVPLLSASLRHKKRASLDQSCPVTSSFIVSPHPCLVTTHPPLPIMCPSLCTSLHALSLGRSTDPGGSVRGPPCPKSAELTGPFPIPRKKLLRWLVVVRHRLHHKWKVQKGT